MPTNSASTAPGTEISIGNCRTGGGQLSAVKAAQAKITNSVSEIGSEIAGFLSDASPAGTFPASFCRATPRTPR